MISTPSGALALLALLLALVLLVVPRCASADGALALGVTSNIGRDGVAYGATRNYPTAARAADDAMGKCRDYPSAPRAARKCRVIATFRDQCFAIAFDSRVGSPGLGWSVAAGKDRTESEAMEACRATSGRHGGQSCKIDISNCDGADSGTE